MTHIVADEIYFQGYRVAILTTDVPATVMSDFEDGVNNATLFESTVDPHTGAVLPPDEAKDKLVFDTIQEVFDAAKSCTRGGLLSLKDLRKVLEAQGSELK